MKTEKDNAFTIIYEPNKYVRMGFFKTLLLMLKDLKKSYRLGWRLFIRDFSVKYTQQGLGILWAFISPVLSVVPFIILQQANVLRIENQNMPYPLFAFMGVSFFSLLQGLAMSTTNVINASGTMISRINFPKESLVISPLLLTCFDFVIKLIIIIVMIFYYIRNFQVFNLLYFFTLIPLLFLGIGVGLFLSVIGAIFKDVMNVVSFSFQFIMFISPVLYPKPRISILKTLSEYNPIYYLISIPRDLIIFGHTETMTNFIYCSLFSAILVIIGWRFFKVAVPRIIEKI